jgi:hypothetical protein
MSDHAPLLERIAALLADRSSDPGKPLLTVMEHTLTDGYARALELESERLRLERRVRELAHSVDGPDQAEELRSLAARIRDTDTELTNLRELLGELQKRLDETRAAA